MPGMKTSISHSTGRVGQGGEAGVPASNSFHGDFTPAFSFPLYDRYAEQEFSICSFYRGEH